MQKGFVAATLKLWVTFLPDSMEKSKNNNNQLGLCMTLVLLQVNFCLLFSALNNFLFII